jgi:hypothetical protein
MGAIFFFARRQTAAALILVLIAVFGGLLIGPCMWFDRVVVDHEHIEQTTGFYWSPTVKGFRYADVSFIRITEKPTGPKKRMSLIWEIHEKNGTTRDIDLGDLWEMNSGEIVPLLKSHGVAFQ